MPMASSSTIGSPSLREVITNTDASAMRANMRPVRPMRRALSPIPSSLDHALAGAPAGRPSP